jgi:HYR domain-containing protein
VTTEKFSPRTMLPCLLLTVATVLLGTGKSIARDLTFEERVAAQEAIERVYYSHQIGATQPFEEAVPREVLESKVRTYLKQSAALEQYWNTPITAEALQREMDRISRSTRLTERLHEIHIALGKDAHLELECFARPSLVNRLVHNFFAFDERIHAAARAEAQDLRRSLASDGLDLHADNPQRQEIEVRRTGIAGEREIRTADGSSDYASKPGPSMLELSEEEYEKWRSSAPARVGEVGPVREEPGAFVIQALLSAGSGWFRTATYTVSKVSWSEWWESEQSLLSEESVHSVESALGGIPDPLGTIAFGNEQCLVGDTWGKGNLSGLPGARSDHVTVWTGNVMIIWGGIYAGGAYTNTGALYDPILDSWSPTTQIGAPSARYGAAAVWTGKEMIVWSGHSRQVLTPVGSRYDPFTDTWAPISMIGAALFGARPAAVWSGKEMIVWSGGQYGAPNLNIGARYDPESDHWTPMTNEGAPSPRYNFTATWTGKVMIVWGGEYNIGGANGLNTGGLYDPATDTWIAASTVGAPSRRYNHTAVWLGTRLAVWGGWGGSDLNSGGLYDPEHDTWTPISTLGAPSARYYHTAIWTGREMIVWGGAIWQGSFDTGGRYDPDTDTWTPTTTVSAPSPRYAHGAVWTGERMLIWGGLGAGGEFDTGGRYDPLTNTWTPTSLNSLPESRSGHAAIWTGTRMVLWGGLRRSMAQGTGLMYDPLIDSWTSISDQNSPSPRYEFTSVWSGDEMLIWGGFSNSSTVLGNGSRYNPISDRWTPMNQAGAPSPRADHTAIWTGSLMIVWGGIGLNPYALPNTGARYEPRTDTWTPTSTPPSTNGAFYGRRYHVAVWTGDKMIIWGGYQEYAGFGATYDPVTDSWARVNRVNEPQSRSNLSAVWTGKSMIVWGGRDATYGGYYYSGGVYNPQTDTWSDMTILNAPPGRAWHTAVWTGTSMVVWGGGPGSDPFQADDSGGRYDPVQNTWTPTSLLGAPTPRAGHSAVWTGREMIVWGGEIGSLYPRGGGRYAPDSYNPPPVPRPGEDRTVECGGPNGTAVTLSGTGSSCNDSGSLAYSWSGPFPEGGGIVQGAAPTVTLPLGASTLTLHVDDGLGHSATDTMTVTVRDTTPPAMTCPSIAPAECSSPNGTPVTISPAQVSDVCDPHPTVASSMGSKGTDASGTYPLGQTEVSMTATDASGNHAGCSFPVTVRDTTPPLISSTVTPSVLWPPNHRMVDVGASVAATDTCSTPAVVLTSVTSSELDDSPGGGDGNTTGDIQGAQNGTANFDLQLRAERDGGGQGRAYRITYTAVDASGNQASASSIIFVPHDQGGGSEPISISANRDDLGTVLTWDPVPGASTYQVIRGNVASLSDAGAFIDLGTVSCIQRASGATSTQGDEDSEDPPLGEAFFYLVAYNDGQDSGYGSDTATKPRVKTGGGCE